MKEEVSIDELSYELSVVLDGLMYYAGVKKSKLEEAAQIYVECIDEALQDSDAEGVDEVIAIVEFMKKRHPKLFEK
ncbi:hypothetical protein KDD93_04640 [Campylobacter sp. faydin G-24]|uniref:Cell division protein n=1 Tax=Campylobacter anatolicus TaxID=2829105 RepID=A0ABS5HHV7_9BACT|nr:hypothetical protein [Campylobacter anatolicus]MBR8462018.1 hypothetical protein [Campylobacter anatolicus]MBR8463864.1 hypothetical protein [Campylobacter anatolicus]MBR8464895.1 hypothetical protein [Campylobacter anatolicus]